MVKKDDFVELYVPKMPNPVITGVGHTISTDDYFNFRKLVTILYGLIVNNEGKGYFAIHDNKIVRIRKLLMDLGVKSFKSLLKRDPIAVMLKKDTYRSRMSKSLNDLNKKYDIIGFIEERL